MTGLRSFVLRVVLSSDGLARSLARKKPHEYYEGRGPIVVDRGSVSTAPVRLIVF